MWNNRRKKGKDQGIKVFSVSLRDIKKALAIKAKATTNPRTKLPQYYHRFLKVFERTEADKLPPLRGPGIDHKIELIKDKDGKDPDPPWGPLFNASREELLYMRKALTEYLSKGFIRVSSSSAAAPVLFIRKANGSLRFCCDYRALNKLSKKDRYPLPLIQETLDRISKA